MENADEYDESGDDEDSATKEVTALKSDFFSGSR